MTNEDRKLIAVTMDVMHGLRGEMQEFRGEMREFKEQTILRVTSLEGAQSECQKNPAVCATARILEAHIGSHSTGRSLVVSIWAAGVSTVMCVFTLFMTFLKRS